MSVVTKLLLRVQPTARLLLPGTIVEASAPVAPATLKKGGKSLVPRSPPRLLSFKSYHYCYQTEDTFSEIGYILQEEDSNIFSR